jgi:hypothetical protein
MYERLSVKWSNTIFGCIAAAMMPIPIILFFWGPKIRSHSRFAKLIDQWQEKQAHIADERRLKETQEIQTNITEEKSTLSEPLQTERGTVGEPPLGLDSEGLSNEKKRDELV